MSDFAISRNSRSLYIGIDPGTRTGLAVWDRHAQKFRSIETLFIHRAFEKVMQERLNIQEVVIEKPPVNFAARNTFRLQGAGSIKRDFSIWEDFLTDYNIPFRAIRPTGKVLTKLKSEDFKKYTGYYGLTSQHGRDAAMYVFQMR